MFLAPFFSPLQQFLIAKKLQELTGSKNIKLKPVIDSSLIAGFVVEYGSSQIDLSVRGQIERVADQLTKEMTAKLVSAKMVDGKGVASGRRARGASGVGRRTPLESPSRLWSRRYGSLSPRALLHCGLRRCFGCRNWAAEGNLRVAHAPGRVAQAGGRYVPLAPPGSPQQRVL